MPDAGSFAKVMHDRRHSCKATGSRAVTPVKPALVMGTLASTPRAVSRLKPGKQLPDTVGRELVEVLTVHRSHPGARAWHRSSNRESRSLPPSRSSTPGGRHWAMSRLSTRAPEMEGFKPPKPDYRNPRWLLRSVAEGNLPPECPWSSARDTSSKSLAAVAGLFEARVAATKATPKR
mmetsp:Transcript_87939/g.169256  ORF Transcript_87939/g.169256 Transcript_87939/m.169256 type:complete len:177 (+) Transcript_87939:80-610(+)